MITLDSLKWQEEFLYKAEGNYRYVIGQISEKPLICIGLNPSTAKPVNPDRTYCKVIQIALNNKNKFSSIMFFNLSPFIDKNPDNLPHTMYSKEHQKNLDIIRTILEHIDGPIVLCAWGAGIEKRPYLKTNLIDIHHCFPANTIWKRIDERKFNHPQHPLYAKEDIKLVDFDIKEYLNRFCNYST